MSDECERWRRHSILLNKVAWRIHEAMGVVPEGSDSYRADIEADLDEVCRLIRLGKQCDDSGGDGR